MVSTFPYGLAVRISGFHPGGPGSTPGMGRKRVFVFFFFFFETIWLPCPRISVICFNVRYWAKTGCPIFRETLSLLLLFVSSYFKPTTDTLGAFHLSELTGQTIRAVKKFLRSRLIMISRRLWNSHQRHKFLRAKASRDILKFRVSEIVFPGVFRRYFPPWTPCYFVRIHARLRRMPSKCLRRSKTSHDSHISHQSKPV